MKPSLLELDPSGDTILVLQCPNLQSGEEIPVRQWDKEIGDGVLVPMDEPEPDAELRKPNKKKKKLEKKKRREQNVTLEHEPAIELEATPEPEPEAVAESEPAIEPEATPEPETAFEPEATAEPEAAPDPGAALELEAATKLEPTTRAEPSVDIVTDISVLRELDPWDEFGEPIEVRLRVSSAHLCLASAVFWKIFRGPFGKSTTPRDGCYEIRASEWDTEAFLVVLDIIHGHNRNVPRNISLQLLTKISTIVDYYHCQESVDTYIDIWVTQLERYLPSSYNEEVPVWLCISWVFRQSKILDKMVELAVMQLQDPLVMTGLPLPQPIIGK
ncbi:unnamed protein product [Clonostachys byssicola]|uniref:BTB domain-containing protein n=1 Tax=Clonostachys byssicola TaxID=160290 RepID=A0A9N9U747_9HYPO|nr:unnamed protein product [Clonostachys byssicola]